MGKDEKRRSPFNRKINKKERKRNTIRSAIPKVSDYGIADDGPDMETYRPPVFGKVSVMNKARYLESVEKTGLLRYLSPDNYEKIWDELRMAPHKFDDQQTVYLQGDVVNRVAIVHEGLIKGEKFHEEGNSHLAHMYTKGEAFAFEGALSGKKTSPMDYISEGDTTVIFFDIAAIYNSSFERELMKGLTELLANDNIKKLYRIETLSQKGLRDRIMTYFHILADKSGSNIINVNMSRYQLAHYLCVNRSALSHEINEMQRDGLIEINKKRIKIL